jgi:hypothetical protein
MVILRDADAVLWFASVTCTTKLLVPDALGVPLICPLLDKVKPAGKLPALSDQL